MAEAKGARPGAPSLVRRLVRPLRALRSKRLGERFGRSDGERPRGALVWVHASSVGEANTILPLVEKMAANGLKILFTTATETAAAMLQSRLPAGVIHQFAPYDIPAFVRRFLDRWTPDMALFVESEIWPLTIREIHRRHIPLVIANGRMSERSFKRWQKFSRLSRRLFSKIDLCMAKSPDDATRFESLGAPRVKMVGNLKYDAEPPRAAKPLADALAAAVAGRRIVLAAATHDGEEAYLMEALAALSPRVPELLLIIAPRHPDRGAEILELCQGHQFDCRRRSDGALPARSTSVYIADTIGELGSFLALADVTFVGGSLVTRGGHNPIEPARLGSAIVTGPHIGNFSDVYASLFAADAAQIVSNGAELTNSLDFLLTHSEARARQVAAARKVVETFTGALERSWALLEPSLLPLVLAERLRVREGEA